MKVLIIDDIPDTVKGIVDACAEKGWEEKTVEFSDSYGAIIDFDPDVVILDWKQDADNNDIGENVLDRIWGIAFRPIIVFSANAALINIDEKLKQSKMLSLISKGDEDPVINKLTDIEKVATSLADYRKTLGNALISSLNSIEILKDIPCEETNSIEYMLSRRTAAIFDVKYMSSVAPAWTEYLCPPISEYLNVCDIIRNYDNSTNAFCAGDPKDYWIVLTPSCDLCPHGESPIRVTDVLCAHCTDKEVFHRMGLSPTPTKNQITRAKEYLNQGYNDALVPLPGLTSVLPYMTVELKNTKHIPVGDIATSSPLVSDKTKYVRIASVSSPFREQIVWAHMLNSCRPGVPERKFDTWAKDLLKR